MTQARTCSVALVASLVTATAWSQGLVAGWGDNSSGQLAPVSPSLLPSSAMSVGGYHTMTRLGDGSVRCFGSNVYGQLSVPLDLPPVARVIAGSDHCIVILADQTVRAWGDDFFGQCQVPLTLGQVREAACGEFHTIAVRVDGSIVCWGENAAGQCTVPAGVSNPTKVAGGASHSMAIRQDGSIVCWGANQQGQCSVPTGLGAATAVSAGRYHSVALLADGSVRAWGAVGASGSVNLGQAVVPSGLGPVAAIDAGDLHTVVRLSDGTVRAWGAGANGNATGAPNLGQSTVPAGLGPVRDVQAGAFHTVALMLDGSIRCWGGSRDEQCDLPVRLGAMSKVVAGSFHAVGIDASGAVKAWGRNQAGQCDVPSIALPAVDVAAGYDHALAVVSDGSLRGWGFNANGQASPPAGTVFSRVSAGAYHSMALRTNGTVACWGAGTGTTLVFPNFRQSIVPTGLSGVTRVAAGFFHSMALRSDGSVVAWGAGSSSSPNGADPHYGQSIVPVDLAGVTAIAAGGYHSVALLTGGTVRCWGRNTSGQCTVPAGLTGVVAIAAGGNTDVAHTVALLADGTVRAWGNDAFGQVTTPAGLANVTSIAAGGYFTLGVLSADASSCTSSGGSGLAMVAVNGSAWNDLAVWDWLSGAGPRVPGAQTNVDLGTYGSVGSECDAQAGSLVSRSGSTLLVPVDLSVPASGQPDHSIDVGGTATLAGRIWLLGSGASVLPADLDIPVLRTGNPVGNFDIIQTTVPAPSGKFLALVPSAGVQGQTLYSLRLLDLTGNASLSGASSGSFSGTAVAAEAMDWDGDGFDDLALAIDFGAGQPGTLQVLLNDGQGNLGTTSVQVSTASGPSCLAVGDVNGDGRTDAVVGTTGNNRAQVYLNNAPSQTPPFTSGFSLNPSGIPRSVCVVPPASSLLGLSGGGVGVGTGGSGDAGGDKLSLFSLSTGGLEQVIALPSTPTTTTTRGRRVATGGASSTTVGGGSEPGRVVVLDPGSTGSYGITQVMNVPGEPVGIELADIDGDGKDEVVTSNAGPVLQGTGSALPVLALFRGQTGGGFGSAVPIAPTGASSGLDVSLIDADGDGDRDIVSVQRTIGTQSEAVLVRIDTTGAGGPLSIGEETDLGATAPILSTRGDLDGVGGEDLFLVDQASSFMGGGSAPVAKPYLGDPGNACPADIDGDGQVGGADLGTLLSTWGTNGAGDINGDGVVNGADLGTLLSSWGPCNAG